MFADIVKSSDIVRKLDPEAAKEIFDQVITQQIEITKKFGGTVNQVMGDGLMCLFGAESPFDDHALRAVLAGREMVEHISSVQKKHKNTRVKIRVGINTGDVIFVPAQSEYYRAAFQVTGEAVHITDRVLKRAQPNQLLVSQATKDFLDRYYTFRKSEILEWNPADKPLSLYEPTQKKKAESLHISSLQDMHTPRISIENRIMASIHFSEERGRPKSIWLHGEAGIGKTHLLRQVISRHTQGHFDRIMQVNFYPAPIANDHASFERLVVEQLFSGGHDAVKAHIKKSLSAEDKHAIAFLDECIADILGETGISPDYMSIGGEARNRMRAQLVARLLLRLSGDSRILLILEDMHWANETEIECVETIMALYKGHERLLILATSRRPPSFDKGFVDKKITQILLDAMTREEGMRLLQSFDPSGAVTAGLKGSILRLAGGNPYFIREYLQWVQDAISRHKTARQIEHELRLKTPGKVFDTLYNKISVLGEGPARFARIASVLGMRVSLDVLQEVSGAGRRIVVDALETLEKTGILCRVRTLPTAEWVFTHELLQKVIYASISRSDRIVWHHKVVARLKYKKEISDRHLVMAFHAEKSEDPLLTYIYSKWAAAIEAGLSRHKSSIVLSQLSRQAMRKIPKVSRPFRHEAEARFREISSLFITGQYSRVRVHIERLIAKKSELLRWGGYDKVLSFNELYLWIKGDFIRAAKIAETILSLSGLEDGYEVGVRENTRLSSICMDLGWYKKAIEGAHTVVGSLPEESFAKKFGLLVQAWPASLCCLALSYAEIGDREKSKFYFERAYQCLETCTDYFTQVYILVYLAHSLIVQSRNAEALSLLKSAHGYCEKIGSSSLLRSYTLAAYGVVLARVGKAAEGVSYCEQALAVSHSSKLVSRISQYEVWYAEALRIKGDYALAIQQLKKTIQSARRRREEGRLVYAYLLIARCHLERVSVDTRTAELYLRKATQIARSLELETVNREIDLLWSQLKLGRVGSRLEIAYPLLSA